MTTAPAPLELGPDHGALTLHTGVEGRAARLGHALTLTVRDWSATVTFAGGEPTTVALRAVLDSLEVTEGHGGLTPLTGLDRRAIRRSALKTLQAAAFPIVTFEAPSPTRTTSGYDLTGSARIAGASAPVVAVLAVSRANGTATVQAVVPIEHTAFGLTPYSAAFGTLRVADQVEIRLAATVPDPGGAAGPTPRR